jgi:hypothetical protein
MKIRLLSPTNIRIDPADLSLAPIGVLNAGVELEVGNRLYRGEPIEGVDTYFRDANGWYYWSGRAVVLYKALPAPRPNPPTLPVEDIGGDWQMAVEDDAPTAPAEPNDAAATQHPPEAPPAAVEAVIRPNEVTDRAIAAPTAPAALIIAAPTDEPRPTTPPTPDFTPSLIHWALAMLDVPELFWQQRQNQGEGVNLMILSNGIDAGHIDFTDNVEAVVNFCAPGAPAADADGMGSALAGLAAGAGRQQWLGVAPKARLWVGKVMNHALDFNYARLTEALSWAEAERPEVLLFGFDFRADSISAEQRADVQQRILRLWAQGTLCVAPVGEGASARPEDRWPGCMPECLSVGAIDQQKLRIGSSLRSYRLDVMAPGEGIAKLPLPPTAQAAALAAGLCALAIGQAGRQSTALDSAAWISLIKETATPQYAITKCRDMEYGCGRLNPAALLEALEQRR